MKKHFSLRGLLHAPEGYLYVTILLILCISLMPVFAFANQKLILQKADAFSKPRRHPYTRQLITQPKAKSDAKSSSYNRLLVLLVQFQEEVVDDPNTTGNGQFQTEADPNYIYSIGAPPHDRVFFEANLEAVRYYYRAVSAGIYDLEYDVYPKDGSFITLPNTMGYYNPPNTSGEQFVALMEEYFYQSFSIADAQFPEINFASYDHYMIIHAGSDWQHDVAGDTPSDIPSFFIHVNEAKAVPVDNGTHLVSHACNVPATISQDFTTRTQDGETFHSGYGAINSVIVHEFGHSLGLVDLYNTRNFQPMVGVFDIMDSGGAGTLVDVLDDGSYVYVEGILPALPGAFSRALLFEEQFRAAGLMQDVNIEQLGLQHRLAASSAMQNGSDLDPTIYKLNLSENEYILFENRSVDPDNDGATAVYSALDGRVILYPSPIDDPDNSPSYEYDYLLPSFIRPNGESEGGGILAWLVNEDVIYNQGVVHSDGIWVSNFDNNTVNTSRSKPGVKVIEADGLDDIGNEWSWWWTGTPYEYFHKSKPLLDVNGNFVSWSFEPWTPEFGPHTKPALTDSRGAPSFYWLKNIGQSDALMTFELEAGFFDDSYTVDINPHAVIAPMINTSFGSDMVPVISNDAIQLFSTMSDPWFDLMGDFPWQSSQPLFEPIVSRQNDNDYDEIILCLTDRLRIVEFGNDALYYEDEDLGGVCTVKPIASDDALFVATEQNVLKLQNNSLWGRAEIPNVKAMALADDKLVLLQPSAVTIASKHLDIVNEYALPANFGDYEPVVFTDAQTKESIIFLISNSGDIWSIAQGVVSRIFKNNQSSLPTQLGIMATDNLSPIVFWGNANRVYATTADGTLLQGFPYTHTNTQFAPSEHVNALELNSLPIMQIPISDMSFMAYGLDASFHPELSFGLSGEKKSPTLCYLPQQQKLYWYYQSGNTLSYHSIASAENPILWAGERNGAGGQLTGSTAHAPATGNKLSIYVYPNPVVSNTLKVRADKLGNSPTTIKVFDSSGRLVMERSYEASPAKVRDFSFDHNLGSGVYYLTLANKDESARIKFAVIK